MRMKCRLPPKYEQNKSPFFIPNKDMKTPNNEINRQPKVKTGKWAMS